MAKQKRKTQFTCQSCGHLSPKWLGKCPECEAWDAFIEEPTVSSYKPLPNQMASAIVSRPVSLAHIDICDDPRLQSGLKEFDRVLGGGLVAGSLILIGGDPGVGKSTLMLQALNGLALKGHQTLYVSGEESTRQIKIRSQRLAAQAPSMLVLAEINLDLILAQVEEIKPDVLVIDSIQTMYNGDITSAPGSVTQVRESTMRLMVMAKKTGIPIFLVGHVTKDGAIAGPRIMEHMVDTVLYFEGDRNHVFRILRAVKNRFGPTNEIGVFEMQEKGLAEIDNPSALFLSECPKQAPGSIITASMEGTRPILVEIQGLATASSYGTPRRTILGLDANRVALLAAVMEKKLGFNLMNHDIYMNVAGGAKITEPAIDMGIIIAIASSFLDQPLSEETVVLGEVGLTGEVRSIRHIKSRVQEIAKMGFTQCLLPRNNLKEITAPSSIRLVGIETAREAMAVLF